MSKTKTRWGKKHKIIHAQGCWNQQQVKPSTLFLSCMTDRAMTSCLGCSSKGCESGLLCCVMAMLVSHSLTFCFVGFDLFCCTPGDTLFSPSPLPSPLLQTQGWSGGERSICEISEVIVTKVAELRLLQSLVGLEPALICRLFWDAHAVC